MYVAIAHFGDQRRIGVEFDGRAREGHAVFLDGGAGVEQEHARPKIRIEVRRRWIGQGVPTKH